jgi:4-diphosphocytidyl-2-C-methyl-D-erythritol kinase
MSVRVFAPAKINLTLEVGRPRGDGMHPIQSAVAFADVGDWIEAAPSDGLSLRIAGPFKDQLSEGDPENLVLRAARALARAAGRPALAALTLEKHLPVASGIGGGSADAAATLRALNQLWSLNFDTAKLCEFARSLGSDAPVCVASKPAYMTGTGADWTPIIAPRFDAVLVNPHQELATALVYREFDRMKLGATFAAKPAPRWQSRADALTDIAAIGNDLAAPASALAPHVSLVIEILRNDARVQYAGVSGSGATCFALADDANAARALAAGLTDVHPRWWIKPTCFADA